MKKRLPAFLFFISLFIHLFSGNSYSQDINVDSLEQRLKKSPAIDKINIYYQLLNNYILNSPEKAIHYANEFLIYAEKYDSLNIINYCYQILGEAHYHQENYNISLDYFKKLLEVKQELNVERELAQVFNNLGIVYRALDDYKQAINYYERSLEINERLNDLVGLSSSYNNLGVLHEHLNLFAQARDYYQKSLDIEINLKDWDGISTSYLNLGGIHLELRNYDKAINFCNKSIAVCDSLGFKLTREMNYEILYKIYKEIGDIKNALFYIEKYYELKNLRLNTETNSKIAELEIKYNSEKNRGEIELLTKQKRKKNILNIVVLIGIAIAGVLLVVVNNISKFRKKKNRVLAHRNEEIHRQNEEIAFQRDEINRQKELAEAQNHKINKQNKNITDSIEYAKNIQIALFPDRGTLQKALKSGFCLFKPRDIVSGDFYWVTEINNKSVIVVADCTGHGVPGAFMSIIGINFLNEIVFDEKITSPDEILNLLRAKVIKTLVHSDGIDKSRDGMDLGVLVVDRENMKVEFAGAYNNLFYISDHMLQIIKADKMPIGLSDKGLWPFTRQSFNIKKGDLFYMFTDGYIDQFGGDNRKKFRLGNLKELLLELHEKDMEEQRKGLYDAFLNWKGKELQVDDILAIGMKIT